MIVKQILAIVFSTCSVLASCQTGSTNQPTSTTLNTLNKKYQVDKIKVPTGFKVDVFAEVPNARSLCLGTKGTLFVGNRSEDNVYAVVDENKDGIADKDDTCPDVAGLAQFGGCPDTDGDGIPDKDDACPSVAGKADLKGCPDADNDGVADKDDACPTVAGVAQFNGCPDTDGDGVEDAKDRCPEVAGKPEFEGCVDAKALQVVIKAAEKKARLEAELAKKQKVAIDPAKLVVDFKVESILFATNSAVIQDKYKSILDGLVDVLAKNPSYMLRLSGHADSRGSKAYNEKLSEARAKACLEYLLLKGVSAPRVVIQGLGESVPAAENTKEAGRKINRRVEVEAFRQ